MVNIMRTALLFGLICIADSIGTQTGWKMDDGVATLGAFIQIIGIIFDITDLIKR